MTRMFVRVDNLHYAEEGTEVRADHTVKITWQVDDGPVRSGELDLTAAHLEKYGGQIEMLLRMSNGAQQAGTVPDSEWPQWPWPPPPTAGMTESRKWGKAIRAYVQRNNIRALDGPDRPAWETPGGGSYWPRWIKRSFAWWCETGEFLLPESPDEADNFLFPYPGKFTEGAV